jgi:hypothetical protein
MANSTLAKYKERISLYEDPDNPLAPLTSDQRQFILDVTHSGGERPVPSNIKRLPQTRTVTVTENVPGVDWQKFNFQSKSEVRKGLLPGAAAII